MTTTITRNLPNPVDRQADPYTCPVCQVEFPSWATWTRRDGDHYRSTRRYTATPGGYTNEGVVETDNVDYRPAHGTGRSSARTSTPDRATEKQVAFLLRLMEERGVTVTDEVRNAVESMTKRQASKSIDALMATPKTTTQTADPGQPAPVRHPGRCATCGQNVPAETGSLTNENGKWIVRHLGACPVVETVPVASSTYVPTKGDVHVIDGVYFRVHVGQTTQRPYGAVWNGEKFVGARHDRRASGSLARMSETTMATAEQAAAFGMMNHACCFCSHAIDTPESEAVGYGPKCASDRGLPWGDA